MSVEISKLASGIYGERWMQTEMKCSNLGFFYL